MKARILITLLTIVGYLSCFGNNHSCVNEEKKDIVLDKGEQEGPDDPYYGGSTKQESSSANSSKYQFSGEKAE